MLALLGLLPLLAALARSARDSGQPIPYGSIDPARAVRRTWRVRLEPMLPLLTLAAAALLIVALARPQRGEASVEAAGEGIDIVLAYDVSSSMTQNFGGGRTRLDAAEEVLANFVGNRTNDRVGLVAFQGSSITLSPLTTDYGALQQAVRDADTLQLADGTAVGSALGASINVLRGSTAPSRIVILLTDGENNAGEVQPLAAARIAERLGVRVYTVGVVGRTNFSSPSTSPINVDEESLRSIAEVTGGTYNRATDPAGLQATYDGIDALETSRVEGRVFTRFGELAPYVLAIAVWLLALEVVLRFHVLRRIA
jgi:Ca-activated chloride channel family protein